MNYKLIVIQDEHQPLLAQWFKDEPWNMMPVENGFKDASGYIVANEKHLLACAYFYTNGSGYGLIDWVCLNPEAPVDDAENGLVFLLDSLCGGMSQASINCAAFYTRSQYLASLMERAGFWAKRNFIQMTKLLKKEVNESHQIQP